jgi:hypothetical protein
VRADDVPVDALRLGVDGAAALVIQLLVAPGVVWTFAGNYIVIWRPTLRAQSDAELNR